MRKYLLAMELGDKVKTVTDSLGIKQCPKCKERQKILNCVGRRGFIGGGVLAAMLVKNTVLNAAWQSVGADVPLGEDDILGFLRTAMTHQVVALSLGSYLDWNPLLAEVALHKQHTDVTNSSWGWLSRLTPANPMVLPNWTLHFRLTNGGQGYFMAMQGPGKVILADHRIEGFYEAPIPAAMPDINTLTHTTDFPGAVRYGTTQPTAWERFKKFLTPTVYAQQSCCDKRNGCQYHNCTCTSCVTNCCDTNLCTDTLTDGCFFVMGCDFEFPCKYYVSSCGTGDCMCCAPYFKVTCCLGIGSCLHQACPRCVA